MDNGIVEMPAGRGACSREKTYFVSDLHLFTGRSQADRHFDKIALAASQAAHFVLGGDIFDFRWSRARTIHSAVDDAVEWLDALAATRRECQFHLLLGNHDFHQKFIDRLADLEQTIPNLSWYPYYFRLRSSVFLHGDVADRVMSEETLTHARSRWLHRRKRGLLLSRLYDLVMVTHVHRPVTYLRYRKRVVAKRILAYLECIGQGPANGVRNVYFGHTHQSLIGYEHGGLIFHNSGSPMRGVKFQVLEVLD
jgi:UDP-2,3-diacylglucosamine hydrolase